MGVFLINRTCRTLPSLLLPNWFSANTRKWYTVHGLKLVTRVSVIWPGRIFCLPWGYQSSRKKKKKKTFTRDPICRAGNASTQNCGNLISGGTTIGDQELVYDIHCTKNNPFSTSFFPNLYHLWFLPAVINQLSNACCTKKVHHNHTCLLLPLNNQSVNGWWSQFYTPSHFHRSTLYV